jgi:hypothetical protein
LVQAAGLAYALDCHIEHVIWGGRTSGLRAQLILLETRTLDRGGFEYVA